MANEKRASRRTTEYADVASPQDPDDGGFGTQKVMRLPGLEQAADQSQCPVMYNLACKSPCTAHQA